MSSHDDDILAETAKILNEAEAAMTSERTDYLRDEFLRLEASMYEGLGNLDENHHLFLINVVPSALKDETLSKDNVRLVEGKPNVATGEEPSTLLSITPFVQGGDIYEILGDQYLSAHVATLDANGILMRVGATATDTQDKSKHDVLITAMLMGDVVYVATRFVEDESKEVVTQLIHAADYEGDMKMIDAMVTFYVAPKMMKDAEPEIFQALYQDLMAQRQRAGDEVFPVASNNSPKEDNSNE